ncbi:MAG: hypothetical protein D4R72_02815 [Nitrosopumilales archaeon]|nr:MAG: hypothetical protein D4R72_02815 [Nitrosopumilales archaeon]
MNKKLTTHCLVLGGLIIISFLTLVVNVTLIPSAFADTTVSITVGSGSSSMCSTHLTCYNPDTVTIQQGETVTWINQDSVGHMIISGNSNDKQTGTVFHSTLISSGDSFAFTFSQAGTYNYFDVLSYWMAGKIIVIPSSVTQTNSEPQPVESSQTQTPTLYGIPNWVRNVAKWWGEGQIGDSDFIKGLQYLIDQKILVVQQSQNPIQNNGNFKVVFQDSRNSMFQKIGRGLEQSGQGTAMENSLNSVFILPSDVTVSFADCGQVNSMYNSDTKTITICYDLIAYYIGLYNVLSPNNSTQATTYAVDATLFTFFHELGHALIDVNHLPATGKEEDAVDQLSTLILLRMPDNQDDIKAVAAWFLIQGLQQNNNTAMPFWDEHSFDLQRFYNIACLAYGKDPIKYGYFITDKILPAERAVKCSSEYQKVYYSWSTLLKPYLKTSLTS